MIMSKFKDSKHILYINPGAGIDEHSVEEVFFIPDPAPSDHALQRTEIREKLLKNF